jgi:DNA-directed RNA polymerase
MRAFMPNFIHSLDAATIHLAVAGDEKGCLLGTIHDCIGARATEIVEAGNLFTAAFAVAHERGIGASFIADPNNSVQNAALKMANA